MRPIRIKNSHLAAALARNGLTSKSLARKCDIHPMTISGILNQRQRPKPETAILIAKALNTTAEKLFQEGGLSDDS